MINDIAYGIRQPLKHPGFTIVGVLALPTFVFFTLVSFASETPKPLGVVPFHRDDTLMLVEARINDSAPVVFAVDTGASHTQCSTRSLRKSLVLKCRKRRLARAPARAL